jgi:hypothetical protein
MSWFPPIIPALERRGQDCEFKTSLDYEILSKPKKKKYCVMHLTEHLACIYFSSLFCTTLCLDMEKSLHLILNCVLW